MPSSNHLACRARAGAQSMCLLHATADTGRCSFQVQAADFALKRPSLQGLLSPVDTQEGKVPGQGRPGVASSPRCSAPPGQQVLQASGNLPRPSRAALSGCRGHLACGCTPGSGHKASHQHWNSSAGRPGMDHQARRAGVLKLFTWPSRGGRHAASTNAKPRLVRAVSTGVAQLPCSATCTVKAILQIAKTQPSDNSLSMHVSARPSFINFTGASQGTWLSGLASGLL